jgi:DNA-binding transcriptional ArsR family regulator
MRVPWRAAIRSSAMCVISLRLRSCPLDSTAPDPVEVGHAAVELSSVAARLEPLHTEPIGALSVDLDATFFALSDPQRRGVLERLSRGPATLSQLAGPSGLTLNGIKKHVGILEFAGLVETEKVGRARECRLGPGTKLGEAGEWIESHQRAWADRLDRFERFVEQEG